MMRRLLIIAVGLLTGLIGSAADAAPLLVCKDGGDKVPAASCADEPLVTLDEAVSHAFEAKSAAPADPLTAMLLRQEAARLRISVGAASNEDSQIIDAPDGLRTALTREKAILDAIQSPAPDVIAGRWESTYATAQITPNAGGYHLDIKQERPETIEVDPDLPSSDKPLTGCGVEADLKPAPDGWYSGSINGGSKATAKIARQGISLRLVLNLGDRAPSCGNHDVVTGTYFLTHIDGLVATAPPTAEKPSFDCGKTSAPIEMDICSDPDLARQDRILTTAYVTALTRVDAETAALLKTDQRNWLSQRGDFYEDALSPTASKLSLPANDLGHARQTLLTVTSDRIAMLNLVAGKRAGFVGSWMSWDSYVSISKDSKGKLALSGTNTGLYYHSGWCDYKAEPSIVNGLLVAKPTFGHDEDTDKTGRLTPAVRSDGRTLFIDADLDETAKKKAGADEKDDPRPVYCERGRSSFARLFPLAKAIEKPFGND